MVLVTNYLLLIFEGYDQNCSTGPQVKDKTCLHLTQVWMMEKHQFTALKFPSVKNNCQFTFLDNCSFLIYLMLFHLNFSTWHVAVHFLVFVSPFR